MKFKGILPVLYESSMKIRSYDFAMGKIILFLLLVSGACAIEITSLVVNPHDIDLKDKFYATAYFDGETCGIGINFLLDNKSFSSKLLGCERGEISSGVLDLRDNPLECGVHTLTAELKKNDEIPDKKSIDVQIGNIPHLTVTPEKPIVGQDITFKLVDNRTGEPVSYTEITIYNTRDREGTKEEYRTDSLGEVKLKPKETGEYRAMLDDPLYCGYVSFYAKKIMTVIGPVPSNPLEGDLITMVVPRGVGVKVLDSSGNVYLRGSTGLGGGLNFTINGAGEYTILIGDVSSDYWGKNISLRVSGKPILNVDLTPETATLGKPLTITVMYNGSPVEGATIDILPPGGVAEPQRITSSYGKLAYTPLSVGKYEITVQKKGYSKNVTKFLVSRQLSISVHPESLKDDEEFSVIIRDSEGTVLGDVSVSINENSVLTDKEGIAKFKLSAGKYEIFAEKPEYNSNKKTIEVPGTLSIKLSRPRIELGENTEISVFDNKPDKIPAEITAIKPDGTKEVIGETYTPTIAGNYEISASKAGYTAVNTTLKVNPHPLNLTFNVEGERLSLKVSNRENPVGDIEISIDTSSGANDKLITDEKGMASWKIREDGIITINLNPANANRDYESRIITQYITKEKNNLLWVLPIVIIIGAIAVFIYRKTQGKKDKGGGKKSDKPALSRI